MVSSIWEQYTIHNTQASRLPKLPQALVCAILQTSRAMPATAIQQGTLVDTLVSDRYPSGLANTAYQPVFGTYPHGGPTGTPETPGMPEIPRNTWIPGQGYSRACPSPPQVSSPGGYSGCGGAGVHTGPWALGSSNKSRQPAPSRHAISARLAGVNLARPLRQWHWTLDIGHWTLDTWTLGPATSFQATSSSSRYNFGRKSTLISTLDVTFASTQLNSTPPHPAAAAPAAAGLCCAWPQPLHGSRSTASSEWRGDTCLRVDSTAMFPLPNRRCHPPPRAS